MHPPFRQRFELAVGPQEASFHATSLKWDTSLGPRFGRPMLGFHGMGTIEVVPAGLRVVARRHRYPLHLAAFVASFVVAAFTMGSVAYQKNAHADPIDAAEKVGLFWGIACALVATAITAWAGKYAAPVAEVLDRSRVELVQMIGPRLRIHARGGDVEVWIPRTEALQGLLHALAAMGIPMR